MTKREEIDQLGLQITSLQSELLEYVAIVEEYKATNERWNNAWATSQIEVERLTLANTVLECLTEAIHGLTTPVQKPAKTS